MVVVGNDVPVRIPARPTAEVGLGKRVHAGISDVGTFDKPNALELGQCCKLHNRLVGQEGAAAKVNVPNPVAGTDQALDAFIGDVAAVSQMHVMQVSSQLRDGIDG